MSRHTSVTSDSGEIHFLRGFLLELGLLPDVRTTDISTELIEGAPTHNTRKTEMERVGHKVALLLRKHLAQQTMFIMRDGQGTPIAQWPLIGPAFMAHLAGAANASTGRTFTGTWDQLRQWAGMSLGGLGGGLGGEILGGVVGGGVGMMLGGPPGAALGVGVGESVGGGVGAYYGAQAGTKPTVPTTGGPPPYDPMSNSTGGGLMPAGTTAGSTPAAPDTLVDGVAGGAVVGAGVGSMVPVVGTAIGAGVGAVVGGIIDWLDE